MQHYAVDERHALAQTLRRAGGNAGTLSGSWNTAHLAAHLVLRERSIIEIGGRLPVRRLRDRAEQVVAELAAKRPYEELVDAIDTGPSWTDVEGPVPVAWLWSIPLVREQANLLEYLIHHEDVRRAAADWQPRSLGVDVQQMVWKRLGLLAKMTLRSVPLGLVLSWPSHGEIRSRLARRGSPIVTVSGNPVEIALFAFGRQAVADVEFDGTAADIAAVKAADISL